MINVESIVFMLETCRRASIPLQALCPSNPFAFMWSNAVPYLKTAGTEDGGRREGEGIERWGAGKQVWHVLLWIVAIRHVPTQSPQVTLRNRGELRDFGGRNYWKSKAS